MANLLNLTSDVVNRINLKFYSLSIFYEFFFTRLLSPKAYNTCACFNDIFFTPVNIYVSISLFLPDYANKKYAMYVHF